jgi:hypothetical protein
MKSVSAAALTFALALIATAGAFAPAYAADADTTSYTVELPLIPGWFKGKAILYLQTEASDPGLAQSQHATYAAKLANAISATPAAVDDIYAVTNYTQANVVPSAPLPEGPSNTNPDYTPLWQVSLVTWANPVQARLLTSEEDVLAAVAAGQVTVQKTNIVVNCSIISSPQGGLFPQAHIRRHESTDIR